MHVVLSIGHVANYSTHDVHFSGQMIKQFPQIIKSILR